MTALQNDVICALATPTGIGAIGVIRISGKDCLQLISPIFSKNLADKQSHSLHFGTISTKNGEIIDEVLISVFKDGKSFTGEESAEIACHGSNYILQRVLGLLLEQGCRMAEPGEFTMRAFLNGKMDLSQAEAVADLIASESKKAHEIALNQLRGNFSNELKDLREQLIHFASLVELELDFSEEDVEFADRTELLNLIIEVLNVITRLEQSFELGNAIKNGVPVAIVGAPNTGKSTLLNQLLQEDRAIVSNIAGTTRDVIEETLNIDGILFRLIDTAGIREHAEEIEALGIERSKQKIEQAKLVLCLADLSVENSLQEVRLWKKELQEKHPSKRIVLIANKADVLSVELEENEISISAKQGQNMEVLKAWMVEQIVQGTDLQNEVVISNVRHRDALTRTREALQQAKIGLETNITGDFVAMDIRQAMYHLGTITGNISEDDLLANIFSKFCIGK
ncbi:MAG TPA: tRNA uridine-5-carboxymethylaminomethyl(34) synthesis GTPase MnmE [Taishania sp.]|nr:tRNA uridine-5-carboxymethylaminomethyl(34) synthesis GTPase MnmE [Taishania sp.]